VYQIKKVESKSDWKTFIDLPWGIYRGDPHWVPPLKIAVHDLLDVKKNPFFKHADMLPLLGYRDGKCIARLIGVVDYHHNQFHEESTAFFGFFEAYQDQQMVHLMLDEVARWAQSKGMRSLSGPMNPSTNYECGLLIEGFNDSPTVMTTYNPPYYVQLLESYGLTKSKDMYAYHLSVPKPMSSRILKHSERIKQKESVVFRPMNLKNFDHEVEQVLKIYNDAWEKNWGFVPMDSEEFRYLAKDLKMIIDPGLCLIAEIRGEAVGFSLTLPDVNQAFKKVKSGKLLPTGLFKILWHTQGPGRKKTINRVRIVTLGIKREFREVGLGPLFYTESQKRALERGYEWGEASWILEDNKPMNSALKYMGGERSKVYRIYQKSLG
jgi:hypothetical protein